MNKNTKTFALIIVSVLFFILAYNIFSGTNNPNVAASSMSQEGETPFYVSLLISWFPFMLSIIFYVLYYQCLRQIIRIGERIAIALETKSDIANSQNTQ